MTAYYILFCFVEKVWIWNKNFNFPLRVLESCSSFLLANLNLYTVPAALRLANMYRYTVLAALRLAKMYSYTFLAAFRLANMYRYTVLAALRLDNMFFVNFGFCLSFFWLCSLLISDFVCCAPAMFFVNFGFCLLLFCHVLW